MGKSKAAKICETNLLYKRFRFFERCQKSEETLSQYVEEIQALAKSCEFETLEESLVRDRVIFGIKNKKLRRQIIKQGGNPTLSEAIELCQEQNGSATITSNMVKNEDFGCIRDGKMSTLSTYYFRIRYFV